MILFHAAVNLAAFLPSTLGAPGAASLLNVLITWTVAILLVVRLGRASLAIATPVRLAATP